MCFRANVWNIGAEGQLCSGPWGRLGRHARGPGSSGWILVPVQILVMSAGVLGGMAWAGIVALLRDRFNTNEILVSLMLVYVATLLLNYLVYGPWKDPNGYNFRRPCCSTPDAPAAPDRSGLADEPGARDRARARGAAAGLPVPHLRGYALTVGGWRRPVARRASRRAVRSGALLSRAAGGLAGAVEVGAAGQLTPHVPVGYGFGAIIVALWGGCIPWASCSRRC